MEVFLFFRMVLVLTVTVTAFWPLNIPLLALAYKVHNGPRPLPLDREALWYRSAFAALGVAVISWGLTVADWFLVEAGFPAGVIHLAIWVVLLGLAMWVLFFLFAQDEPMQAAGLFLLYIGLPGTVLFLFWLIGITRPLALAEDWLAQIPI